jgi:Zn-dependent protease
MISMTTASHLLVPPSAAARERRLTGVVPHLVTVVVLAGLYARVLAPEAGLYGTAAAVSAAWFAAGISAALILHEAAHAVTATVLGRPVRTIHLDYLGGHVEFPADIGPRALLAAILAGPAANLAAGAALGWSWWAAGMPAQSPLELAWVAVAAVNLINGAFNLMPAPDLDGDVAIEAASEWLGASAGLRTAIALLSGTVYALALIAVPVLYAHAVPLVVAWSAGAYGVYVLHACVQRARGRR